MPARSLRILAYSLLVALCAMALKGSSHAQAVAPRITIDSVPPGAMVSVDGAMQGQSGPNFKVRITKGQHRIKLQLPGYKDLEQTIAITTATKLTFNLENAPARLDVKFTASNDSARGADIYVDGTPAGTVPQQIDLPAGRHLVEIKKPGNKIYSEQIEVKSGETRPIWAQLTPESKSGGLIIQADASDAEVFVDGVPKGKPPVSVDNLNEGEHLIEVRRNDPGAPVWRQTVRVVHNQQVKVTAQTAPPAPPPGSLLVISSVNDAEITVDATQKGKVGQPLNLPPGQHSVAVSAKGYTTVTRVIEIEPGKPRIEKIDLVGSPESRGVGFVRIVMLTPVDGAQYFVNGRRIDESAALSDQGVETAAGRVVVSVTKEGFGTLKREVNLRPASTEVVEFELKNTGRLYVASQPPGAFVLMDRNLIGQTPLTRDNIPAGPHTIEIQNEPKYSSMVEQVNIRPGEQEQVSVIMKLAPPPPIDKIQLQKGLSSFSAVTIPFGHFTADVATGYPWFINARINVGVWKKEGLKGVGTVGLDMGAEFRSTFYHNEVGGNLRLQLFQRQGLPFAIGLNTYLGGGGGPRQRNSVEWELGIPITILAGSMVKLTARPYLQVYSDRHCPDVGAITEIAMRDGVQGIVALGDSVNTAESAGDRCVGRNGIGENSMSPINSEGRIANPIYDAVNFDGSSFRGGKILYDPSNPLYQVDGTGVLERFTGVRFMLQAVVEFAVSPALTIWGLIEGAPGQKDRQLFTDKFNRIFPLNETPIYGRLGMSLKF